MLSDERLISPQLPESAEPNTAQEYRALVRALRRKKGFGLFFVQASPAKGQEILTDLRRDLAGKRVAEVTIGRTDDRLFDRLEALWEREPVDIFWIEGLEQSLLGYEDMQRLAGWDEQDLMTYSWKDVPPILSHFNLGRERFEARFDCTLVFVVPLFVVKYLLRRAGDFFDWKSGFFEFPDDRLALAKQIIRSSNYSQYLELSPAERLEKILQTQDLLNAPEIATEEQADLLYTIGRLFTASKNYEQAVTSFDRAIQIEPNFPNAWLNKGFAFTMLGRYEDAVLNFRKTLKLAPEGGYDESVRAVLEVLEEIVLKKFELSRFRLKFNLDQQETTETDLRRAISIAQAAYKKDPINYQNTFNLALYHLAAGHHEESDRLYTSNLTAPIEWLQMAIDDLDDFLHLFPDHPQAQQVKQLLQGAIQP